MKIVFICCGLPGIGYHGGAMTCWAIIETLRSRGHEVTLVSLFDTSDLNPYRDSKDEQRQALQNIGVVVKFIEHDARKLRSNIYGNTMVTRIISGINLLFLPTIEKLFFWSQLSSEVESTLDIVKPDAIFCYHFDALSAVYNTKVAPLMAGVGDLWHLPLKFRLGLKQPSFKKYFVDSPYVFAVSRAEKKCMIEMLKPCIKKGAFAAHYAQWLKKEAGFGDALYLRTPIHDSVGRNWQERRNQHGHKSKPRILLMGDLATTSTLAGLRVFISEILPKLEEVLGKEGFEIRIVGGGNLEPGMAKKLQRPSIKLLGRVVPADEEFLSADLLLVPTPISLGIRVRIITAFSFGTPVISHNANACGIPEMIDNENALIGGNPEQLAKIAIKALKDKELRDRIGAKGRETYERFFAEEIAAGVIVDEIEGIVQSQPALVEKSNL